MSLIEMFNLQDEVEDFVKSRVKALTAKERHDFSMSGHPQQCPNTEPHPPHATGTYNSIRHGWGSYMCDGREGDTPEGKLSIVFQHRTSSSAHNFGVRRGYWFIKHVTLPIQELPPSI